MPVRKRITWGSEATLSDPRLQGLDRIVREIRRAHGRPPQEGVKGGKVFENSNEDLPARRNGYYHEYDVQIAGPDGRGKLRIVLGDQGEVWLTGNHYDDFRQIINMPS